MKHIGIFLDRDGTINQEVDFLSNSKDLQLIQRSADAIREANENGWKVIILTNQSGVARRLISEENVLEIHTSLKSQLQRFGASIDAIYYCPHHPDEGDPPYRKDCDCRKPKIGMIMKAVEEFDINLKKSFVIGDKMIDVQTGNNCGATSILVLTGYGKNELLLCRANNIKIDFVATDLYDAIQFVKRTVKQELPYIS